MKEAFLASLVREGAQGGGLYAYDEGLVFKAQKLTMPEHLKHIKIPYDDIRTARCVRSFVFPAIELTMKGGAEYKIIVFERRRLLQILDVKNVLTIR